MQQTSSSAKVKKDVFNSRKIDSNRLLNSHSKQFGRMKSNNQPESQEASKTNKPRSSIAARRPPSAIKPSEISHSLASTCSARSEKEVKDIIHNLFQNSGRLQLFLNETDLENESCQSHLIGDQVFTLSLVTMLGNRSPEETKQYVQRSCIEKLKKIEKMKNQNKKCKDIESKIEILIESRIITLLQLLKQ